MLDQFKSLCQEATMLENNNHSLEIEACDAKQKLTEALDKICDLKQQIECLETLNRDLENEVKILIFEVLTTYQNYFLWHFFKNALLTFLIWYLRTRSYNKINLII